jgi:hypothetical protein
VQLVPSETFAYTQDPLEQLPLLHVGALVTQLVHVAPPVPHAVFCPPPTQVVPDMQPVHMQLPELSQVLPVVVQLTHVPLVPQCPSSSLPVPP